MNKIDIDFNISNDIENVIISALFNRNDVRSLIFSKIKIDNFTIQNNRILFRLMKELFEDNKPIDLQNIKLAISIEDIENPNDLLEHLVQNILSIGYVDNINSKIDILINKSTKTKIEKLAKNIIESEVDYLAPDSTFDSWSSELDEIINSRNIGELELISNAVDLYQKKLDFLEKNKGKLTGITSGFSDIDNLTNGFQAGDLIILAARPSMGKTALAINFILNAAESINPKNESVVFFSLEMSNEQIINRMITNLAQLDAWKLRTGELNKNELKNINANLERLKTFPIYIEDKPNMTILEIESRLRQLIQNSKIKLVVIDYLQLIESTSHNSNRVQEVAKISRKLKIMARELNIPIIAIAQLSRKIEERKAEDRQPMLSDLRESGSIEQDADLVTFIDYDRNQINKNDLINSNDAIKTNDKKVLVVFYIEKHRNGATGRIKMWFNKHEGKFIDFKGNI